VGATQGINDTALYDGIQAKTIANLGHFLDIRALARQHTGQSHPLQKGLSHIASRMCDVQMPHLETVNPLV
jgi:hypothetical protein